MPTHGFCNTSIAALRAEPTDRAEMVTQLFFGEMFTVLEESIKWAFIRNERDNYNGWIDRKQFSPISESSYTTARLRPVAFPKNLVTVLKHTGTQDETKILFGTPLPLNNKDMVEIDRNMWEIKGEIFHRPIKNDRENIVKLATSFLNAPYLWGGKTHFGMDCSGLTQTVYNMEGITLPRDAYLQAMEGETVNLIEESLPGDLLFFDNQEGKIIHVGILAFNNTIIHASGRVRIDPVDHYGIFNKETQSYSHKLRIIKRFVK